MKILSLKYKVPLMLTFCISRVGFPNESGLVEVPSPRGQYSESRVLSEKVTDPQVVFKKLSEKCKPNPSLCSREELERMAELSQVLALRSQGQVKTLRNDEARLQGNEGEIRQIHPPASEVEPPVSQIQEQTQQVQLKDRAPEIQTESLGEASGARSTGDKPPVVSERVAPKEKLVTDLDSAGGRGMPLLEGKGQEHDFAQFHSKKRRSLDQRVEKIISTEEGQQKLINEICPSVGKVTVKQLVLSGSSPTSKACLSLIGNMWQTRGDIITVFSKVDPTLHSEFFQGSFTRLEDNFLTLSTIKHLRAKIASSHLNDRMVPDLFQRVKHVLRPEVTLEQFREQVTGLGFNRMFSKRNRLGGSPASDADFKLSYSRSGLSSLTEHGNWTEVMDKLFRIQAKGALNKAKTELSVESAIDLEVGNFTIQSVDEIERLLANSKERLFLSTIRGNNTHVFGGASLHSEVNSIIDRIPVDEAVKNVHKQYLSEYAPKGSYLKYQKNAKNVGIASAVDSDHAFFTKYAARVSDEVETVGLQSSRADVLADVSMNLQLLKTRRNAKLEKEYQTIAHLPENLRNVTAYSDYEQFTLKDFLQVHLKGEEAPALKEVFGLSCGAGLVRPAACELYFSNIDRYMFMSRTPSGVQEHALFKTVDSSIRQAGMMFLDDLGQSTIQMSRNLETHISH